MISRAAALAAAFALLPASGAGAAAEPAAPRALEAPRQGPIAVRPFARPLRDRVIAGRAARARVRAASARASAETYTTPDGYRILVEISPSYVPSRETVQAFVDFLGGRLHGEELGNIGLYIATPDEVRGVCGAEALACYFPARSVMVIPGEQTPSEEAPLELVITHEYGHHIATYRRNDPWTAFAWGPKRWATYEHVCELVGEGQLFPGDEGERYAANPGEAWAEAYALYHYRAAPWRFVPALAPDGGSFAALERDVREPWTRSETLAARGSFSPTRRRAKSFPLAVALDGRVSFSLTGPRGTDFGLQVLAGGRIVDRSLTRGSRDRIAGSVCGATKLVVRVVRLSGYGRFRLRVVRP